MGHRVGLRVLAFVAMVQVSVSMAADKATKEISGSAPTVCTASVTASEGSLGHPGTRLSGHLTELCNDVNGYRLVLAHPSGLTDASVQLNGVSVPLNEGATRTVITDSNHARYLVREFALVLSNGEAGFPLTLYTEPKGAIF